MRRRILLAVILVAAALLLARFIVVARDLPAVVTAAQFDTVRHDHTTLRAFLREMPKGGDLHVHLSGAVYAERLIAWAISDGLCLRVADMTILDKPKEQTKDQPCGPERQVVPIAEAMVAQGNYDRLINALSMRWFNPSPATPSGHDQFFATFGRYGPATSRPEWSETSRRIAEMTVDQLRQYDAQAVQYAEFMVGFFTGDERQPLAKAIEGGTDPAAMLATLKQNRLDEVVAAKRLQLAELTGQIDALRDCDAARTKPGCGVTFRFIAQINRNGSAADVFAHTALAAALIRVAPKIVAGLNYVGPEDYRVALRDYRAQMKAIGFLARDDAPVALHAGELWIGLVPIEDLAFHIRDAVETAGARRIGHGVAIAFERDTQGLMAAMRRRNVVVEVNLTSNDVILGVRGKDHPLPTYLAAGVPVVLSTDDAGVSRINLTNEYFRAARDYELGYRDLKAIARNALIHAFLAPDEKPQELDRFDRSAAEFERATADRRPALANLAALIRAALVP